MQGEIIKSFLVGLGFDVDESSLAAFNKGIQSAALRVTALYGSINALAGGVVFAFSKISDSFEEMGYQYHIIAPAVNKAIVLRQELIKAYTAAGINIRKTIVDSINLNMSLTKTRFAMEAIYKSVGSKFFGLLQKQSDTFRKKLYENMPYIINALTKFVNFLFKAFDATIRLGERVWSILGRVYEFFADLDRATNGWSTTILAVVAAWKLLNLSFLASPLGMLFALAAALLLLWDDFKTFQEGGESLIDWGSDFTKMTVGLIASIGAVAGAAYGVIKVMELWKLATEGISTAMKIFDGILSITEALEAGTLAPILLIIAAVGALVGALALADAKWQIFGGHLSGFFGGIGSKVMDFLGGGTGASNEAPGTATGGSNVAGNLQNSGVLGGTPLASPLGSQGPGAQNNTNANMQTSISITGSPNPDATARAVAGQQQSVNRDFARNLKGPTR